MIFLTIDSIKVLSKFNSLGAITKMYNNYVVKLNYDISDFFV